MFWFCTSSYLCALHNLFSDIFVKDALTSGLSIVQKDKTRQAFYEINKNYPHFILILTADHNNDLTL